MALTHDIMGIAADMATTNARAAEKANQISFEAQQRAMDFNAAEAEKAFARNLAMMRESNAFSAAQANVANKLTAEFFGQTQNFNAAEAEKQRQWEENMSNTSYQRAVADLKAAGLNPVLALMKGGASTPSGSAGSIGSASGAMANAHSGSVGSASAGSFTGILENTSNELAMIGAITSAISSAVEAFGKHGIIEEVQKGAEEAVATGINRMTSEYGLMGSKTISNITGSKGWSYDQMEHIINSYFKALKRTKNENSHGHTR